MNGNESLRVLVVDDERAVRELLQEGLEAFGYSVESAASAAEAREKFPGREYELVLCDIEMPVERGTELLVWLKQQDPDLPVIMVTGVGDAETAVSAMLEGACDYICKPFSLPELKARVEQALEKRRLVLENREYQDHLEQLVEIRTRKVREAMEQIRTLHEELTKAYDNTLSALMIALDYRDNETQGHSLRVVGYVDRLARELVSCPRSSLHNAPALDGPGCVGPPRNTPGMPSSARLARTADGSPTYATNFSDRTLGIGEPELIEIRRGAMLHDVGKIGIADSILRKPGPLDEEQRRIMEQHPRLGFEMLDGIGFLEVPAQIVLAHQENWDGSGYPRGLRAEQIPIGARLFAVADTLDAMTSDRPYRAALGMDRVREELRRFAGRQFDPRVVEVFLRVPEAEWWAIRERVQQALASREKGGLPADPWF